MPRKIGRSENGAGLGRRPIGRRPNASLNASWESSETSAATTSRPVWVQLIAALSDRFHELEPQVQALHFLALVLIAVAVLVVLILGGAGILMIVDLPAPSAKVEHAIPDSKLPK